MIIIYQWLTPSRTCKGGSGRDQFWGFAMVLILLMILGINRKYHRPLHNMLPIKNLDWEFADF